jgi:hypothetical protein
MVYMTNVIGGHQSGLPTQALTYVPFSLKDGLQRLEFDLCHRDDRRVELSDFLVNTQGPFLGLPAAPSAPSAGLS